MCQDTAGITIQQSRRGLTAQYASLARPEEASGVAERIEQSMADCVGIIGRLNTRLKALTL